MKITSLRKLVSVCAVIFSVLLVYSVAPPLVAEGSDAVAGSWIPVSDGQPCNPNGNTTLYCNDGAYPGYGVYKCGGGGFDGVSPGYGGYVHVTTTPAGCYPTGLRDQQNCNKIFYAYCLTAP